MKHRKKKKGASLIIVLMVLAVAMIFSSVTLTTISKTTKANAQEKKSEDVLFSAESGLEYGIAWFNKNKTTGVISVPPTNGCTYDVKVEQDGSNYKIISKATINGKSKTVIAIMEKIGGGGESSGKNILTENTLNGIGDPSKSNNIVSTGNGQGSFKSKGSVSLQGNSVSLDFPMDIEGDLMVKSNNGVNLGWSGNLNISGNTYVKSTYDSIIRGKIISTGDLSVVSGGGITLENSERNINGNVYFKSGKEVALKGPLNSSKDTTIIADKDIVYGNYTRQIKGSTYVKSSNGSITVNTPMDVDGSVTFIAKNSYTYGNYNTKINGPLYIKAGNDISLNSPLLANSKVSIIGDGNISFGNYERAINGELYMNSMKNINFECNLNLPNDVTIIANNILFNWYSTSFLKNTFMKAKEKISFNNPAKLGNAYIEADNFYKNSTITTQRLETSVKNFTGGGSMNPTNINVASKTEPSKPQEPQEPLPPQTEPESPIFSYNGTEKTNGFIIVSDTLAYCKLNSSDSNFKQNLKNALSPSLNIGNRYKLLVIEGDCKINWDIVDSRSVTNLSNYIIYTSGEFYNDENINFKNSVIYANKITLPWGNISMTAINDSPTIPFTKETQKKVEEYLSKAIKDYTSIGGGTGTGESEYSLGKIEYIK